MGSAIFTATVSVACIAPGPIPTGPGVTVKFSCEVTGSLVNVIMGTWVAGSLPIEFRKDGELIMELAGNSTSPEDVMIVPGQEDVLTQSQISATLLSPNILEVTITDFPQRAVGEWYCESPQSEFQTFYYDSESSTDLETFCGIETTEAVAETTEPASAVTGSLPDPCNGCSGDGCDVSGLLDVVFIIDWSKSSISKEEIKEFSKQVAGKLDLEGDVKAGAVYFKGKAAGQLLGLDATGVTSSAVCDAIDSLPTKKKGQTKTHLGLEKAKQMFELNSRIEAGQVAVVITDGASDTQIQTYQSATNLQALGVRMCAVQFGSGTETEVSNRDIMIQALIGDEGQKLRNEAAPDSILSLVDDTLACIRSCPIPGPPITLSIRADDGFELYADGVYIGSGNAWATIFQEDIKGSTTVIAFKGINGGGPHGLAVKGPDFWTSTTEFGWKCSPFDDSDTDWADVGYDDSAWPAPISKGNDGGIGAVKIWSSVYAGAIRCRAYPNMSTES